MTHVVDSTATLLVSMFVSLVGFALLVYGKKQRRVPQLSVGLLLMAFPYFVPSALLITGIAALLLVLMAIAIKMGL